jgi:hypothetical protein
MSTLGKILLVINLLAAAGVAYLASQAWAKRQEQNTALLKFGLYENGFPLESPTTVNMADDNAKVPFVIGTASGRSADSVRVKVLKDHFAGAKGEYTSPNPPSSVVDEVKEVQKQFLESKVAGFAPTPAQGLAFLVGQPGQGGFDPGPLTLLADDFEERVTLRRWLEAGLQDQQNAAKWFGFAQGVLARKFNEVVQPANTATADAFHQAVLNAKEGRDNALDDFQKAAIVNKNAAAQALATAQDALDQAVAAANSASTSDLERRRKAAVLLTCIDRSAAAQKRTALVVGMKEYTAAVYDRVSRFKAMPDRYERTGESDVADFAIRYEQRLAAAKDLDRLLTKQRSNRESLQATDAHLKERVAQRERQKETAAKQAGEFEVKVNAASAVQAGLERDLVELQKQAAALLNANFNLEDELIKAEQRKAANK